MNSDVVYRAMKQVDAIKRGEQIINPTIIKVCGDGDYPPDGLADGLSEVIGRPVIIEWSKKIGVTASNTGSITDATTAEQRYYEDAARRGAKTGD